MFGSDDNHDQNQNHNIPIGSTPLSSPALPSPTSDGSQTSSESVHTTATPSPIISPVTVSPGGAPANNDLLDIKQQALQHLSPLVGKLEQSPEEKFRTTMMMIQASDDQNLVKDAYEAAKLIPDEKARAQALLDVINEINYFTQQKK